MRWFEGASAKSERIAISQPLGIRKRKGTKDERVKRPDKKCIKHEKAEERRWETEIVHVDD